MPSAAAEVPREAAIGGRRAQQQICV